MRDLTQKRSEAWLCPSCGFVSRGGHGLYSTDWEVLDAGSFEHGPGLLQTKPETRQGKGWRRSDELRMLLAARMRPLQIQGHQWATVYRTYRIMIYDELITRSIYGPIMATWWWETVSSKAWLEEWPRDKDKEKGVARWKDCVIFGSCHAAWRLKEEKNMKRTNRCIWSLEGCDTKSPDSISMSGEL